MIFEWKEFEAGESHNDLLLVDPVGVVWENLLQLVKCAIVSYLMLILRIIDTKIHIFKRL